MRVWGGQLRRGVVLRRARCLPLSLSSLTCSRQTYTSTTTGATSHTVSAAAQQPPPQCTTTSTARYTTREVIPADSIVIEEMVTMSSSTMKLSEEDAEEESNNRQARTTGTQYTASTSTTSSNTTTSGRGGAVRNAQQPYWDITHVDPFARSRVVNFMRRTGNRSAQLFLVRQNKLADGRTVYTATCRLTLPAPHFLYIAEGMAETVKDAELLAAMHAERVCDALGVPLFQLPSMQRKHALLVRQKEGRYAPMPEDPVRQDNGDVPPPLRMISHNTHSNNDDDDSSIVSSSSSSVRQSRASASKHGAASSDDASAAVQQGRSLFATTITEAELVMRSTSVEAKRKRQEEDKPHVAVASLAAAQEREHTTTTTSTDNETPGSNSSSSACDTSTSSYAETVWYPWSVSAMAAMTQAAAEAAAAKAKSNNANNKAAASKANNNNKNNNNSSTSNNSSLYDITEHGMWQLVNCVSARCSPSPQDALVLPFVFDPGAHDRIQDYFLQHHLELRHRCSFAHVLAAGCTTRMYIAELKLVNVPVSARGKAATKEMALKLAAMHAELVLDALGEPLFPRDAERQARHAAAVARYGRWATGLQTTSTTQHTATTTTTNSISSKDSGLPLPLKQLSSEDETWFDTALLPRQSHSRSLGERMVAVHNTLRLHCSDGMEVNPPPELLREARELLRDWQVRIARNPHPELFIPVKMGDVYLASTVTPVPRRYGIRGGIGIGKTMEQAIGLCALHAVDGLCALRIPLFRDAGQQARFMARRRALGMVTHEAMSNLSRMELPNGTLVSSILLPDAMGDASHEQRQQQHQSNTTASCTEGSRKGDAGKACEVPPYLPAYTIDFAGPVRLLPNIRHTRQVLALRIPDDFELCGDFRTNSMSTFTRGNDKSAKEAQALMEAKLVEMGNCVKICVLNYLRYVSQKSSKPSVTAEVDNGSTTGNDDGEGKNVKDAEEDEVQAEVAALRKRYTVVPPVASVYLTGVGKRLATQSIAYLPIPLPDKHPSILSSSPCTAAVVNEAGVREVLAIGMAPKRKDADRLCFLHAAAMLYAMDEDVVHHYRAGLPRQASLASFATVQEELNLRRSHGESPDNKAYWPRPYIHPSTSAVCKVEKLSATAMKWR